MDSITKLDEHSTTLKWDIRFLRLALEISSWSKDPSTKVGAIAVNTKRQIVSTGYNGFPRGIVDSESRYSDRETKYRYVVHAEMNVIYNACYNGAHLDGATIYATSLPICDKCADGIIQVGIRRAVMIRDVWPEKWTRAWEMTAKKFDEAGISWVFIDKSLIYNK